MSHVVEMHQDMQIETLFERRSFHLLCLMYKILNNEVKDKRLVNLFRPIEFAHGVGTRANTRGDLIILETRTKFGEFSIQVFGSRAWNIIPDDIRKSKSFNIFVNAYYKLVK